MERLLALAGHDKPENLAARLISEHRTLGRLLCAVRPEDQGGAATILDAVRQAMLQVWRAPLQRGPILSTSAGVLDFLNVALRHEPVEVVWAFYLDAANQLIRDEPAARGSVSRATIYPRDLVARALQLGATGIILAHNHPSGSAAPSADDVSLTNRLIRACHEVDLVVHDHIIVAGDGWTSLRGEGLLDG